MSEMEGRRERWCTWKGKGQLGGISSFLLPCGPWDWISRFGIKCLNLSIYCTFLKNTFVSPSILFLKLYFYIYLPVYICAGAQGVQKKTSISLDLQLRLLWAAWCRCRKPTLGLLPEQEGRLTAEPSLQPPLSLSLSLFLKESWRSCLEHLAYYIIARAEIILLVGCWCFSISHSKIVERYSWRPSHKNPKIC